MYVDDNSCVPRCAKRLVGQRKAFSSLLEICDPLELVSLAALVRLWEERTRQFFFDALTSRWRIWRLLAILEVEDDIRRSITPSTCSFHCRTTASEVATLWLACSILVGHFPVSCSLAASKTSGKFQKAFFVRRCIKLVFFVPLESLLSILLPLSQSRVFHAPPQPPRSHG